MMMVSGKRMLRPFIAILLVLMLFGSLLADVGGMAAAQTSGAINSPFSDVQGHWAREQIGKWAALGIAEGSGGKFRPGDGVSRAELVKLVNVLFGYKTDGGNTGGGFIDVEQGKWYTGHVAAAREAGYMAGYPDGSFKPGGMVTRQDAAKVIGALFYLSNSNPVSLEGFQDKEQVASYAADALSALVAAGSMKGFPDGTLRPQAVISRAELLVLLDRVAGEIIRQPGQYSEVTATGNMLIASQEVALEDSSIAGNLLVTPGADGKGISLEGVTVKGTMFVNGGDSVRVSNSTIAAVEIARQHGKSVEFIVDGSMIGQLTLSSDAVIVLNETSTIEQLTIQDTAKSVTLGGKALTPGTIYQIIEGQLTEKGKAPAGTVPPPQAPAVTGGQSGGGGNNGGGGTDNGNKDVWKLVWSDEFDKSGSNLDSNGLDLDKWGYQEGTGSQYGLDGWGNEEQQYYSRDNIKVEDGKLTITAKKEQVGNKPYTSGRIWTSPTFSKTYGKFEAKIKMPVGEGLWPAFWMMPQDSEYGGWASSGEIDIMEARGRLPEVVGGTAHFGKAWPNNKYVGGEYDFPAGQSIDSDYHIYAVEWEPGELRWYVDGKLYYKLNEWSSQGEGQPDKYAFPAPFDKPFHMILNLAVGGTYDGNRPPPDSKLPAQMEVDYVRAYELAGRPYRTPVEPVLNKDPIPAEARKPVNGSYISDPDFERGLNDITVPGQALDPNDWNFLHTPEFGGAGSAAIEPINQRPFVKIIPTQGGNQNYSLQLIQHVPLVKGRIYKLSFDAKASANRSIAVKLGGDADNGWAAYSDNFDTVLSSESNPQHFEYRFQMSHPTDVTARLEFNVGLDTNTVWIGNVRLEEVEQLVEPNGIKTPLENGNHVYNGSFDLGTMDRMTFWNFLTEGATAHASVDPQERALNVKIADGGGSPESVRLIQKGIELLQSDEYELSFDARSDAVRGINVKLASKDGLTTYHESTVGVGVAMTSKIVGFTMPEGVNDQESQLIFELGGSSASIKVDQISLIRKSNHNVDYSEISMYPLINGQFESDLEGWEPFVQDASATFHTEDRMATIQIANSGGQDWNVMLMQPGLELSKGITYKLSFEAKSSEARNALLTLEDAAYQRQFDSGSIALGTAWKTYDYTFKVTKNELSTFKLQLGNAKLPNAHEVSIRNVVLEMKDAPLKRPPLLKADQSDNRIGESVELTFTDHPDWRSHIRTVLVKDEPLEADQYTIEAGRLKLAAEVFPGSGSYTVKVLADGYAYTKVTQTMIAGDGNLLANGSFTAGTAGWELLVNNPPDSQFEVKDGTAEVQISYYGGVTTEWGDPVPVSWYTQLVQKGVKIEQGKAYELSFRAWSSMNRPIFIELTGYSGDKLPFSLTDDQEKVHRTVIRPANDAAFELKFLLGNVIFEDEATADQEHIVWIDDVVLRELPASPEPPAGDENLALHKKVVAYSSNTSFNPAVITDGNTDTRWEADYNQNSVTEWVYIDLEKVHDLNLIQVDWERAYPAAMELQVADTLPADDSGWTTVESLQLEGAVDDRWTQIIDLSGKNIRGRYVRIFMTDRHFPPYGPSIYEVIVQ